MDVLVELVVILVLLHDFVVAVVVAVAVVSLEIPEKKNQFKKNKQQMQTKNKR